MLGWAVGALGLVVGLAGWRLAVAARRDEARIVQALDALDEGFALWSADDRLLHANRRYREIYAESASQLTLGIGYEQHLRIRLSAPSAGVPPEAREAYVRKRLEERKRQSPPMDVPQAEGRWVRTIDRRTVDGSMVSVRIDVSDIKAQEVESRRQALLLQSTFDNITDGLIVVDGAERLALWNANAIEILGLPKELAQVGRPYRDMLAFLARRGDFGPPPPGASGDPVAAIVENNILRLPDSFTRTLASGRIVEFHKARMAGGGFLSTLSDITRRIASTQAAAMAHRRLVDAIESFPEGFALFDADDRLVTCNARYREMYRAIAPMLVAGTRFEDQVRAMARTNESLVDPAAIEAHVAERMRHHREPNEPFDVRRANGRWIRVIDRRTADGGTVAIRIDISDLRRRETVLTIVVETAQRLLVETRWRSPVEEMLTRLGHALGVSRTMLGRNKTRANGKITQKDVFEWDAPGIVRILGNPDFEGFAIKDTAFQDWRLARSRGETVYGIVRDLPADKQEWLGRQEVQSLIRVPVMVGGTWWGSVGFDHCRVPHRWEPLEIEAIKAAATLIGIAIQREVAAEQVERQREALFRSEKMAAMGSLLAGVAHELNNPLAIVVGQASLLRETAADERTLARADRISQAADRCARIVRTFLAMARQRPPERAPVDLRAVVRSTVDLLSYALKADGVGVELDLPDELPAVWGDGDQIAQVVSNLVVNAQQAVRARSDGRMLRIGLSVDAEDAGFVTLGVSDNGGGVPEALRTRIFDPFFTTKPQGAGTGVGLSVCRGIVEAHDGSIEVDDSDQGGARFTVRLPVSRGDKGGEIVAEHAGATRLPPDTHVLLVDDEPDILRTLGELLEDCGARTQLASNGDEALARLANADFDLVFCDMRMPVLDGPGLYKAVSERAPDLARRFVFVTGDVLSVDVARFLNETTALHIEKPFRRSEIMRTALAILERH
ncbi:MAG: PAS-domain containing protein [Rhodospirillales bacterium]|nr:PAS-domain containing protein [Rhodospirillales bacterium]